MKKIILLLLCTIAPAMAQVPFNFDNRGNMLISQGPSAWTATYTPTPTGTVKTGSETPTPTYTVTLTPTPTGSPAYFVLKDNLGNPITFQSGALPVAGNVNAFNYTIQNVNFTTTPTWVPGNFRSAQSGSVTLQMGAGGTLNSNDVNLFNNPTTLQVQYTWFPLGTLPVGGSVSMRILGSIGVGMADHNSIAGYTAITQGEAYYQPISGQCFDEFQFNMIGVTPTVTATPYVVINWKAQ